MRVRTLLAAVVAVAPRRAKPLLYRRLLGYQVSSTASIGVSLIDVARCRIGAGVSIGHGNFMVRTGELDIGDHVRVGHLNVIRGGESVILEPWVEIMRLNELNSIPDPIVSNPTDPRLRLGAGTVLTAGHKIDFTDRVDFGRRVILGGRNSSVWTHNRQRTAPVTVGDLAYIGSEIRMAPGSSLPGRCIVGIGSVISGAVDQERHLIAGVPARALKPLSEEEVALVERKTREDLPESV